MKNLTEDTIHQIVGNSIRKFLNESSYSIKEPYYKLISAIDAFENAFENDYDTSDENVNAVIQSLETARQTIDDFVRHPEGNGNSKVWDNVGF